MPARPLLVLLCCLALSAGATRARAEATKQRVHVVYDGQRLASIAKRYQISVEALCKVNGLKRNDRIRPGQKLVIPAADPSDADVHAEPPATKDDRGAAKVDKSEKREAATPAPGSLPSAERVHRVEAGQRLGSIAKRYGVSIDALCRANGLRRESTLRPGQRLTIPDGGDAARPTSEKEAATPAEVPAKRRGYIELYTYTARYRGQVIDRKGKLSAAAVAGISRLLGVTGSRPQLDTRLVRLLVAVSDAFGGRPIRIVSGYRTSSYFEDSRHKLSRAVDFSVPGVSNERLRDFLRRFPDVGVGYYPNSSFVHLDVRETATYWVDYAGPGQAPRSKPRAPNTSLASHDSEAETDADAEDGEAHADQEPRAREQPTEPASLEVDRGSSRARPDTAGARPSEAAPLL